MTSVSSRASSHTLTASHKPRNAVYILRFMNALVLFLSVWLIVRISLDTFNNVDFLADSSYMTFQFWVCIIFVFDFFIELYFAENKLKYFGHRILFLLLSIPYLNIINNMDLQLSHNTLYFIRFIPLARGALAMSIVLGYLSSNAVTGLFISYLSILVMITYFCSLIFFRLEMGVNHAIHSYRTALWCTAMNLTTVGCDISPVTPGGKIITVVMPICGMIMFPLFTVYLTDFVTRKIKTQ